MYTVGSIKNLNNQCNSPSSKIDSSDIQNLNKKIKTIKSALKIAQQHNEQLHLKIKKQKQAHSIQLSSVQKDCQKYKSLYEMMIQKFQNANRDLKELKKKMKKHQLTNTRLKQQQQQRKIQEIQQQHKYLKNSLSKQQVELQNLQNQNVLLREELVQKTKKNIQLELEFTKWYQETHKSKNQVEASSKLKEANKIKDQQNQVLIKQKQKLENKLYSMKKEKELFQNQIFQLKKQNQKLLKGIQHKNEQIKSLKQQLQQIRTKSKIIIEENDSKQDNYEQLKEKYNQMLLVSLTFKFKNSFKNSFIQQLNSQREESLLKMSNDLLSIYLNLIFDFQPYFYLHQFQIIHLHQHQKFIYLILLLHLKRIYYHKKDSVNQLLFVKKISTFKSQHIFAKNFLAFFTCKYHFNRFFQLMIRSLIVTISTIKPFFTTLSSNSCLNIKNMFAHTNFKYLCYTKFVIQKIKLKLKSNKYSRILHLKQSQNKYRINLKVQRKNNIFLKF